MATKFTYIPATQDGFTLQPGDTITRKVHETQAIEDAHTLHAIVDDIIDLDSLSDWIDVENVDGDYASRLMDEIEELNYKLN